MLQFTLNLIVIPERNYYNTFNLSSYVYLHCTTIISLILTFTYKYSAYSSMFIQFYIFWNSAILETIYGIYQARERLLCRLENNLC